MIGKTKSIYHSTLAAAGEVTLTIKGDVIPSKDRDGNVNGEIVKVEHDGAEQWLKLENDNCAEAMKGLSGKTVTVKATGARDAAKISVDGAAAPQGKSTFRAPKSPVSKSPEAADVASQCTQAYLIAMEAVNVIRDLWDEKHPLRKMTDEQFSGLVGQLNKQLSDKGSTSALPVKSGAEIAATYTLQK